MKDTILIICPLCTENMASNHEGFMETVWRLDIKVNCCFGSTIGEILTLFNFGLRSRDQCLSGFFDDIYVPANQLPQPCHHIPDPDRRYKVRWIWEYDIEETGNSEQYNIDGFNEVRFQVISVNFPTLPIESQEKPFAPVGSISDCGLWPVSRVLVLGRNRGYRHIVVIEITVKTNC